MIVLALLATVGAILWTLIVLMANGMSDAPMAGFQGGLSVAAVWCLAGVFYVAWWVG